MANGSPWFIFDINNKQIITSKTIPGTIKDSKDVILSETPIPGSNYQPVTYGGGGNRKISLTLPILNRNGVIGNIGLVKQFEALRNRYTGLTSIFSDQFTPNPKVLYSWGTGSLPLVYWVKNCQFSHEGEWVNYFGAPQYTMVDLELWLDESNILYKAEEIFRKISGIAQTAINLKDLVSEGSPFGQFKGKNL